MFDGLDEVDWAKLEHAYGPATDVPQLLRALLSTNADERREACDNLHFRVWHQGTIYSASAAIIPFLFELLSHDNDLYRGCAVTVLCCIATGEGWLYGSRIGGGGLKSLNLQETGRALEDSLAKENVVLETIRARVSAGLRSLIPYLNEPERRKGAEESYLAALVAEVFGLFPEHSSWTLPIIDAVLEKTSDEYLRQHLLNSKTRLT